MRYGDTDSYITQPYQIADHYCRITWVYNKRYYDLVKKYVIAYRFTIPFSIYNMYFVACHYIK